MADYKASNITGSSYQRAYHVRVTNPLNGAKGIVFSEEKVFMVGGETTKTAIPIDLAKDFTAENAGTAFPLLDGNGDPTGETATYTDVYQMLMSLYYHCAQERDNQ